MKYNKNDSIKAQKRLFGTIKNIGNKIKNRDRDELSKKGEDPAYRYIKNSNANWKDELTDEEGEKALRAALEDCPDNLPEGMEDMLNAADELEDMVDDLDAELEDMDEE